MARARQSPPRRNRIGQVSVFLRHHAWWVYYRADGRPVRRRVATDHAEALHSAAELNRQLQGADPNPNSFQPITVRELRAKFLQHHEDVLHSSLATIARYRTATQYVENFSRARNDGRHAHDLSATAFTAYLRTVLVQPNGRSGGRRRHLRDKGVQFILQTVRSMYSFAARHRHLPPYANNPLAEVPIRRLRIRDAKPIFVFDPAMELAFLQAADDWAFAVHFTLAKTGLRSGELTRLLIEDLDLEQGWLHVRNKPGLGWWIKTGQERRVPLVPEVVRVLRRAIGGRSVGPVFLRPQFWGTNPPLVQSQRDLERTLARRCRTQASRLELHRLALGLWRDAGAVKPDAIRTSFVRIMAQLGRPDATCPKSWRHTFATLLQDANVDPLIRQQTLGHRPSTHSGLGMTGHYTHTRPETLRRQIEMAIRMWPQSLVLAQQRMEDIP
jgi:integrase